MNQEVKKEVMDNDKNFKDMRAVYDFVKGDDWKKIRRIFVSKMVELDSLAGIDLSQPDIERIIASRMQTIDSLQEILAEVEGTAQQYSSQSETINSMKEDEILKTFE